MAEEKLNTAEDEISLKELILKLKEWYQYLLTKWRTILIAGILGGALGLVYAFIKKPVYTATTTFVLEEGESSGGLGAYAGIASMVGIDLGGGGGGIFKGDNIIELYKSRKMIQETLLSQDTFAGKQQLLIDRYIEFNKLREDWQEKPELVNLKFSVDVKGYNRLRDSIMGKIVEEINGSILQVAKPDKKLSIIKVDVKSKDELFAKSFADNIVAKVNQFYVGTKTKKSMENVAILQYQTDSVRRVLNKSIGGVASEIDANPNANPAFQTLRVGSQKRQVDVQAAGAVYEELVKNLELSKITLRKEKPLIQVIDEPVFPLKVDKVGKAKGIFFGGIFLGFLTTLFLIVKSVFRNSI
ncbi:Wzz/FepE/Etk N-terminal domain-containing protein [Pedobacter puniceum]|uniref:Lipopolysaccharide biosynthesis protein n=1 Tax=Pedobacter puniceum TaxID=2666136 RepID=A0A7K0FRL3_9SPHI|nr:Wzz/FepE/Etk N-terminal domain-containing protein [Pedobacter puniceum]MRX48648.1 lipopolysaccharide biosynthesis protein [Pedobacter puniceum]